MVVNSTQQSVRELAQAHYSGLLSRENYRNKRSQLLNDLVGEVAAYDVADEDTLTTRPRARLASESLFDRSLQQNLLDSRWPVIIFTALMAIVVLVIIFTYTQEPPPQTEVTPQVLQSEMQVIQQMVESFVVKNVWETDAVIEFVQRWDKFPLLLRNQAMTQVWFKQFEDELRARILEQRALTDLKKNSSKSVQESLLVSFGEHLGIRIP